MDNVGISIPYFFDKALPDQQKYTKMLHDTVLNKVLSYCQSRKGYFTIIYLKINNPKNQNEKEFVPLNPNLQRILEKFMTQTLIWEMSQDTFFVLYSI